MKDCQGFSTEMFDRRVLETWRENHRKVGAMLRPNFWNTRIGISRNVFFQSISISHFWELLRAWWQRQEIDNMRGQHHDVAKQQQELLQILGLTLVSEGTIKVFGSWNSLFYQILRMAIHDLPFGFLPSTFPAKPSLCRKYI